LNLSAGLYYLILENEIEKSIHKIIVND